MLDDLKPIQKKMVQKYQFWCISHWFWCSEKNWSQNQLVFYQKIYHIRGIMEMLEKKGFSGHEKEGLSRFKVFIGKKNDGSYIKWRCQVKQGKNW